MGNCTSEKSKKTRQHQLVPQDIHNYDPELSNAQKLQFEGSLCNIRVKNCPKKLISIQFDLDNITSLELPTRSPSNGQSELKWKQNSKFTFVSTEYHLRKTFLKIVAKDEKNRQLANLKINLFYIVNGPYHHDFGFPFGKETARLIFDLKISEVTRIQFQPEKVQIELAKEYPGEDFTYSFKLTRHDNCETEIESELSSTRPVDMRQKSGILKLGLNEEAQSPQPKRNNSNRHRAPSVVNWNKEKNFEMPGLNLSMNVSSLLKSEIIFVLWRVEPTETQQQNCIIFADLHFPFAAIFEEEGVINMKTQNIERIVNFQEFLLSNGKPLGQVDFSIKVSCRNFFKQSKACARTEDGVVNMTRQFDAYTSSKSAYSQNRFVEKLSTLQRVICQKNLEMNNMDFKIGVSGKVNEIRKEMYENFEEMLQTLKNAYNEFASFNSIKERENIFQEQQKILNIIEKLYPFIGDEDVTFSKICWSVIVRLMKRSEFSLKYMEFTPSEIKQIKERPEGAHLKRKIAIALNYQRTVNRILILALNSSYSYSMKDSSSVVDAFKAYCYVRAPAFRKKVLASISRENDLTVQQWKYPTLLEEELMNYEDTKKFFMETFDWDAYFYRPFSCCPESRKLSQELAQSLENTNWFNALAKRNREYFFFVQHLMLKLQELSKKAMFDKYHHIPGYNTVVRSFLYEMKTHEVVQYPSSMQLASIAMLANEKLLNVFMGILARKTNSYDQPTVVRTLDLIDEYFYSRTTAVNKPYLPMTFDYLFFFQAIKQVIENSFTFSTCKAILLLFTHYSKFSQEFRKLLMKYMLGKAFFKLFLHWSYSVRKLFHHLLAMKLTEEFQQDKENFYTIEAQKQYQHVMSMLMKAGEAKKMEDKLNYIRSNEKDLYKIMRKKLVVKRSKEVKSPKILESKTEQSQKDNSSVHMSPARRRSGTVSNGLSSANHYRLSKLQASQNQPDFCDFVLSSKRSIQKSKENNQNIGSGEFTDGSFQSPIKERVYKRSTTQNSSQRNSMNDTEKSEDGPRRRRCSVVSEQNFELCEIEHSQQVYICIAADQYREIASKIRKHVEQYGQLPKVDLGIEIPMDQKQIRPTAAEKLM